MSDEFKKQTEELEEAEVITNIEEIKASIEETQTSIVELIEEKKFSTAKQMLEELNAVDIAELFDDASHENTVRLFRLLNKDVAAEVFSYMDTEPQQQIIEAMTDQELRTVLDEMYLDDTVDIMSEMPANIVSRLIRNAPADMRGFINQFLNYPEDSAGSIMTIEYVELGADMTVEAAFNKIRATAPDKETIYTCYVTGNGHELEGVITVKQLLLAPLDAKIADLMDTHEFFAHTHDAREDVALNFSRYGLLAMPVVDSENRLVGIVTVDDAMDVLEEEATEDIEKMAAITPTDKPYLKLGIFEIWRKRIPWLLILMVSSTFTGKIISSFEAALAIVPVLTAFIPMIMGTGGNASGQASVTVIRGLALDEIRMRDILRIMWKELAVSVLAGVALGLVNLLKIFILDNLVFEMGITLEVAIVVSLTLTVVVIIAKIVGGALPVLAKRLGFDPAVMANPFITTIVDTLALLIYFGIATIALNL